MLADLGGGVLLEQGAASYSEERLFVLAGARIRIGRDPQCEVRLSDPRVSGCQAQLLAPGAGAGWLLVDLGSRNGSFVAGRRLPVGETVPIPWGSALRFGSQRCLLLAPEQALALARRLELTAPAARASGAEETRHETGPTLGGADDTAPVYAGDLSQTLLDVLQRIELERTTGWLRVATRQRSWLLTVSGGQPWRAYGSDGQRGAPALQAMLDQREGFYEVRLTDSVSGARELHCSAASLIVEGARRSTRSLREALSQAEQGVRGAQREALVGQLAAGLVHDLHNVLSVISTYGELLGMSAAGREAAELGEGVRRAARQATTLTRRLLTLGREREAEVARFDLAAFVADELQLVQRLFGGDVDLAWDTPTPVWVEADDTQVGQVLLNLVLNARDAMPGGGALRVEVTAQGAWAVLRVRDEGCGVTPELQERLFEPFVSSKGEAGTGLGLTVVAGIVRNHGGRVELAPGAPRGTVATVELPLAEAAAPTPRSGAVRPPRGEQVWVSGGPRELRDLLLRVLIQAGYDAVGAPPLGSGPTVLVALDDAPAALAVAEAQGWGRIRYGERAGLAAGEAVLERPVDTAELLAALGWVLGSAPCADPLEVDA